MEAAEGLTPYVIYVSLWAMIKDNLTRIQQQIVNICQRLGRNPDEVVIVGVTKFADPAKIEKALDAGLKHIAENKVQEGQKKFPAFKRYQITKHLIGHLQTNKAKAAVELFDMIHSVDSLKLAQEIEKHASMVEKNIDILIQVSTSGEKQKFGIVPAAAAELIEEISKLSYVRVKGLMTMAPLTEDKDLIRACFRDLRVLQYQLKEQFESNGKIDLKYLSMGMSGDYEIALEEGSNMVRIGSAIFSNK